jgi:hypothetical protein
MEFACLSYSTCKPECKRCWMTVLVVLAYRLNMCCAYPVNAAMPAWK